MMSARWVAGSVRAEAMARRRLGRALVQAVAASANLSDAVEIVARSPYGRRVSPGASLAEAQRGVAETLLWNLRVLAGWLPAGGAEMLRLVAGWFEIANVDEHLRALADEPAEPPFSLGTLATAWPRLAGTGSRSELRAALRSSPWGDPGADDAHTTTLWLRLVWAGRVSAGVPRARRLAAGAAALVVARELFVHGRALSGRSVLLANGLLGGGWSGAAAVGELADRVPAVARWALVGLVDPADLWRAEARWWTRLRTDGGALLASSGFGPQRPLGAVAVLGFDAWQVRAALELAARSSAWDQAERRRALEVFDALA